MTSYTAIHVKGLTNAIMFRDFEEFEECRKVEHKEQYTFYIETDDEILESLFVSLCIDTEQKINEWFSQDIENADDRTLIGFLILSLDFHYTINMLVDASLDELDLFKGNALEYCKQYMQDATPINDVPDLMIKYFDYARFTNDMLKGGDIAEFNSPDGYTYTYNCNF